MSYGIAASNGASLDREGRLVPQLGGPSRSVAVFAAIEPALKATMRR